MGTTSATYGVSWGHRFTSSSFITVQVECVDCHRRAVLPIVEPSSRYYGAGNQLESLALGFMPVPDGWHRTGFGACQLQRCADCFNKWDAAQEPAREARRAAERQKVESKSVLELLTEMAAQPFSQMDTSLLREAIRKLRGSPPGPPEPEPHP